MELEPNDVNSDSIKHDTPTKKEISEAKEQARKKRKENAQNRKAKAESKKRKNPITVTEEDGKYTFHGRSLSPTKDKNEALAPYAKIILLRGKQLRLYPTEEQMLLIAKTNGCARVVRNEYLKQRIARFESDRTTLTVEEFKKDFLPKLKEEKPWLKEVDKFALEAAIEHVNRAYVNFFEGNANFPKAVKKHKDNGNRYTTKQTNDNIRLLEDNGLPFVKLPKLGNVRFALPFKTTVNTLLSPNTRITKATVIKIGKAYFVSLALETIVDRINPFTEVQRSRIIAMDMGIRKFCDYGPIENGYKHVENPHWIKLHERRLRRFQRALSRKKYDKETHTGSKNWEKAKERVAKEHLKILNQRKDFQHQLSAKIAKNYDIVICEDLNIKGMVRNRHLAKEISSVGWGKFLSYVKYKLEAKGGMLVKVGRWFPSSKLCSCGYKNTDLKSQLVWKCPVCHKINERDDNAVDNLLKEGLRILKDNNISIAS